MCGGGATTYTASACSPNTYTLTVTNPFNNCSNSGTVSVVPSAGVPVVSASNSGSITCNTTTATISASTTMTPVSYAWTGPGAISGSTTSTGTVSLAGSYQCIVTNTLSGCASTITTVVPSNTTVPVASIAPTSSITCTTASLVLNASPTGAYSYSWIASAGLTGTTVSNPTVTLAGTYSVVITNTVNGCAGSASIAVVSNTAAPTVTVSPGSYTTTCASPTVQLTATSSASNSTYSWTVPSTGALNTYTISTPIANGSGIFTVSVTDASNGCSTALSQATVEIVADAGTPVITLNSNTATITCSNPTPSVVVTTTSSPVSYSWSPTNGIVAGTETTAIPSFSLAGTYSVIVTNTVSGCTSIPNIVNVSIDIAAPVITLSSTTNSGTITCLSTSLVVTPTVSPSANVTYTWSSGSGISSPINQAAATFTAAGVYTLVVTNTLTGCVSSTAAPSTFTVIANTNTPTVSIMAISTNTVIGCGSNSSVTYSAIATSANGSINYLWNPGAVVTSTFNATTAGVYNAIVIDAVSGCSTTTQFTTTGNSTTPNLTSTALVSMPCGAASATLSANSTNTNVSYLWTGPITAIITGSTISTPTVYIAGNYAVTVTDLATGCSNSNTVAVTQTTILATFTANPTSGLSPLTVNFTNQTTGANSYNWSFGNGAVSSSTNPNAIYTGSGSYTVTLIATAGSCSATATAVIVVEDGLTLVIPNVFTPNGDGINDVFTILSTGVKEISLSVFNRWGLKLYDFSGPKAAWDGITGTGEKASDGTYFYFVKVIGFDGKEVQKNGTVNLFR